MENNEKSLAGNIILSFAIIQESESVKRIKEYFETGYYPEGEYCKTWDILAYCDYYKRYNK